MSDKTIRIKQVKSAIGRQKSHQACLKGLGIRRMNQTVSVIATPANVGMVKKIAYMLEIEEA